MARSTTFRRSRARSGEWNGDHTAGDWMIPAIVAASASDRLLTSLAKNRRDASATPCTANEPRCPRYTSFRYSSRISSFDALRSRMSDMNCSSSLRRHDRWPRRRFPRQGLGEEEVARELLGQRAGAFRYRRLPRRFETSAPTIRTGSMPG